jgi:hypothetical protein
MRFMRALQLSFFLPSLVDRSPSGTSGYRRHIGHREGFDGGGFTGAKVKIVETETDIALSLVTNADGFYSAPALHIGKYSVSAQAAGFATQTKTDVELRVQDRLDVDFNLAPGQMSTVVTVESQVPPLQTEDSSIGQVVDDETMQNLPLNGRNYIQLATLGAGTSPSRAWR